MCSIVFILILSLSVVGLDASSGSDIGPWAGGLAAAMAIIIGLVVVVIILLR